MNIVDFTPWSSLAGGLLIGAATALVLLINGKIAGVSGVFARIFRGVPGDTAWRVEFVAGLIVAGGAMLWLAPATVAFRSDAGLTRMLAAGFLVGFGTRVGGGCTSGHGVCGVARGSKCGIAATLAFMFAGALVVYVSRHLLGGVS